MDTTSGSQVTVAAGEGVLFEVVAAGRAVRCSIGRDALEQCFWLPAAADEVRLLKAFSDGQRRIVAVAERKALRLRTDSLNLTSSDFEQ
jgi:Protein of unknown function (DUF1488)